jgi:nucleotide-binding universal stress UspA family protein
MRLLTLKSILVATDLEEGSWPALRTAARLARLAEANLHLLHVADTAQADAEARLTRHFHEVVRDAAKPRSVHVLTGPPASVIPQHAIAVGADVVLLGPHRKNRPTSGLGSTAARVVRNAPCPILVVATELELPLRRVVVPIDLSNAAAGALATALSWASALRPRDATAHVTALHVTSNTARHEIERAIGSQLERVRERGGHAAHVDFSDQIVSGAEPAEVILRSPVSASADLLVMGTRGEARAASGLGSVSAGVAEAAFRPLLLVPPAVWEQQV